MNEAPTQNRDSRSNRTSIALVVTVLLLAATVILVLRALRPPPPGAALNAAGQVIKPGSVDEILNTLGPLKRDGEFAKALVIAEQAAVEHPKEQALQVELAEILFALKRQDEAYARYDAALEIGPRTHALEIAAGTLAAMLGKADRAQAHFAAAQASDPTDWKAPLFLAQVQIKQDKLDEAKKNLLLAAKLRPQAATAWGTLADIALRENKTELALQHIAKARELEPDVTVWRLVEARALKRENKPQEALDVLIGLDEARRLEPGVLQTMGECLGMLGRPEEGAKLYSRASDAMPERGDLALQAAQWWVRAGRKQAGIPYAQRASDMGEAGAMELLTRLTEP